jgi:hypothetical protein
MSDQQAKGLEAKQVSKTYTSGYSLVVTHLTIAITPVRHRGIPAFALLSYGLRSRLKRFSDTNCTDNVSLINNPKPPLFLHPATPSAQCLIS